jgi:hypothetical protein
MTLSIRRLGIALGSVVALVCPLSPATAQAPRQIRLPQPAHLQPISVWQQYNLQQSLLQQNALQQYALQQLQFQNALLYPALPLQPTVIYPALPAQQQNALLYSMQQLQQENAILYGMLQQQAALQQLQQAPAGGQPGPLQQLLPR